MNWKNQQLPSDASIRALASSLSTRHTFPEALANILYQRGIHDFEQAKSFFAPSWKELHDPYQMKGMELAVERIWQAYQQKEKILIYGDYDVDGTSAVTLMCLFMERHGFEFEYYIPDRYSEGYGISVQGVSHAAALGTKVIIALDCGIKALAQALHARDKGMDLIICDHHTPGAQLPEAYAILDPKQSDCPYPYKELTGCGIGFKLVSALFARMTPEQQGNHEAPHIAYCDLLTLSIACDIVPITGENRLIAFEGLKKLQRDPLPGIKALMDLAEPGRPWDISDLVFFLGPHINAAGRLESARSAVELLLGKPTLLPQLAENLKHFNLTRKEIDKQITEEALEMIDRDQHYAKRSSTVVYHPKWHKGVIGIVASRLIERHYRPTVVLTRGGEGLVGSARSVEGFDLYQALDACAEHLSKFGGHKYAAGLSLQEAHLPAFMHAFDTAVASKLTDDQKEPTLYLAHELQFSDIDARFIRLVNRMAPFGPRNRRPIFVSRGVEVLRSTTLKGQHVRFVFEQASHRIEGIAFNFARKWQQLDSPLYDIAYQPVFNHWNNTIKINLRIKDIKPS